MNDNGCSNLRGYLAQQRDYLRRAIDENKWYLSERQGHDVGIAAAQQHFIENHFDRVAHDFRLNYCRGACVLRTECPVADQVHRIPPVRGRG